MVGGYELQAAIANYHYLYAELNSLYVLIPEYNKLGFFTNKLEDDINTFEEALNNTKLEIENMGGTWE